MGFLVVPIPAASRLHHSATRRIRMSSLNRKSAVIAATLATMMASVSTAALAQAPAPRTLGGNEAIFIDGKTLTVAPGRAKDDIGAQLGNLNVRPLGPGAIVFRA